MLRLSPLCVHVLFLLKHTTELNTRKQHEEEKNIPVLIVKYTVFTV